MSPGEPGPALSRRPVAPVPTLPARLGSLPERLQDRGVPSCYSCSLRGLSELCSPAGTLELAAARGQALQSGTVPRIRSLGGPRAALPVPREGSLGRCPPSSLKQLEIAW